MSGYDNPLQTTHRFEAHDFGAGAGDEAIRVPNGKTMARIADIFVSDITEAFTDDTTAAFVRVGTAADPDKFAELDMVEAAISDAHGTRDDTDAIKAAGNFIDLPRDGDSGAALAQLEVTFVAPTGGTPAGIGSANVVMEWW
jgi:hypothetical protein